MLLPSALPCDGSQATGAKSSRPLLQRFMPYSSSSTSSGFLPTRLTILATETSVPAIDTAITNGLPSPLLSPSIISSGIQSTCRALQSFLGVTPSATTSKQVQRNKIPLPPTTQSSPLQVLSFQDKRISRRRSSPRQLPMPSRGKNKRTRDDYESTDLDTAMDMDLRGSSAYGSTRDHDYSYDSGYPCSSPSEGDIESAALSTEMKLFSTPKRRRRLPGPISLPFGLDRQDFADLENPDGTFCTPPSSTMLLAPSTQAASAIAFPFTPVAKARSGTRTSTNGDYAGEAEEVEVEDWWTPVDDEQLVTLVLEKMKLSRRDWEDCAKVLGAEGEGGSLGKRWRWLMEEGKVGLKMGIEHGGRFEGRRASRRQARGDVRMIF